MEIKSRVLEFIENQVNTFLDAGVSPVSRGKFKQPKKTGGRSQLLETGALRSALKGKDVSRDKISYGVHTDEPKEERLKMFGHQTGFQGHPTIPNGKFVREVVPNEDGSFKRPITSGIRQIINEVLDAG